jgi:hypothetical protein
LPDDLGGFGRFIECRISLHIGSAIWGHSH